jgi:hypothetical protein
MILRYTLAAALLALALGLAAPASAQPFIGDYGLDQGMMRLFTTSFYADYIHKTTEGKETGMVKGLVARTGEKMRMDNDMRGMAGAGDDPASQTMMYTGMIMKPSSPLIMLYHVPEKYMIMEQGEAQGGEYLHPYQAEQAKPPVVNKVKVGEEKFDNHPCIIYDVTTTYSDGKVVKGRVWEATDYGDTKPYLKIDATIDGVRNELELHNVKLGAPAASWFEVPEGYVKINDMMELFNMGAMMGGG